MRVSSPRFRTMRLLSGISRLTLTERISVTPATSRPWHFTTTAFPTRSSLSVRTGPVVCSGMDDRLLNQGRAILAHSSSDAMLFLVGETYCEQQDSAPGQIRQGAGIGSRMAL